MIRYISCFLTAFFYFTTIPSQSIASEEESFKKLSQTMLWRQLLHLDKNKNPQITDPNFLLSNNNGKFSLAKEASYTFSLMKKSLPDAYCRFPARVTYISDFLDIKLPENIQDNCPYLQEYTRSVPFDYIELVFASEVVSSATSMMGHVFLKAGGLNFNDSYVEHSLAYYTEIKTLNPVALVSESLYTGMPGFFSIKPFKNDLSKYKDKEQRNLWRFKLKADKAKLNFLQLHLWELKGLSLTYLFQSYNCATMTLELISLLGESILEEKGLIVTPTDVVKAAQKHNLIESTNVEISDLWKAHMLSKELTARQRRNIDEIIKKDEEIDKKTPLSALEIEYFLLNLERDATRKNKQEKIDYYTEQKKSYIIDVASFKSPVFTPQDSSFTLKLLGNNRNLFETKAVKIGYLPAGHFLRSDNRQYLSESELLLGYTSLSIDLDDNKLDLDEFTLYGVKSLSSSLDMFPTLSSELYIGYRPQKSNYLIEKSAFELSGMLGKTYRLQDDIMLFWLVGGGVSGNLGSSNIFSAFKVGSIINLVSDLKFNFEYVGQSKPLGEGLTIKYYNASLTWLKSKEISIGVNFSHSENNSNLSKAELEVSYYF
ncbi:DUF4105 domain-containing protein [Pseudoalteromonas sp. SG43-5]|uniref:lipoprotein N-acyltransferase Lnb domain-containing protein n=1 Tax=Pseudoalteromonas sp. SG43-5 TaxID=2760968 RepID=UPI001603ADD4|nr:DUF4105 domain-containing protein [Pseudoalteromonas sp. SG43-5]MBB1457020.1 DUF4105 domain-containing protein [Pseudoalteromonas sp. SG43-5]